MNNHPHNHPHWGDNDDHDYQSRAIRAHGRGGHVSKEFNIRCRQLGVDRHDAAKALAEIAEAEAKHHVSEG